LTDLQISAANCTKMRLAAGPAGGAIALPRSLAVIRGKGGRGWVGNGRERKGREGKDVKG